MRGASNAEGLGALRPAHQTSAPMTAASRSESMRRAHALPLPLENHRPFPYLLSLFYPVTGTARPPTPTPKASPGTTMSHDPPRADHRAFRCPSFDADLPPSPCLTRILDFGDPCSKTGIAPCFIDDDSPAPMPPMPPTTGEACWIDSFVP